MVKTDCFAYTSFQVITGKTFESCKALDALYCKTEECKFYKNLSQACAECLYDDCNGCAAKMQKPGM